jgi:tRNA dimethylallyltransferase
MSSLSPLLIAGPTASGKSALALARAAREPSLIVNADSMQVYRDLRVLTARPAVDDELRAAHALYGFVDGADAYSAGRYVLDVARTLEDAQARGLRPIIVGGTGLYFKALLEGLSPVPPIPTDVRAYWRAEAERHAPAELHLLLAKRDPETASRLRPSDPQRVTRALEVLAATGRPLAEWHRVPGTPLIDVDACERVVVLPERTVLFERADARLDAMIAGGALDEVRVLAGRGLDAALPVMRALGVHELMQHVQGALPLADAMAAAKQATRHYIKRQATWLKRNMYSWDSVIAK